jgi:hypothetical protein
VINCYFVKRFSVIFKKNIFADKPFSQILQQNLKNNAKNENDPDKISQNADNTEVRISNVLAGRE